MTSGAEGVDPREDEPEDTSDQQIVDQPITGNDVPDEEGTNTAVELDDTEV